MEEVVVVVGEVKGEEGVGVGVGVAAGSVEVRRAGVEWTRRYGWMESVEEAVRETEVVPSRGMLAAGK